MKASSINITCLLLAVAGISFGIGQTVGQDRAEAGAQSAKVQLVKDKDARKRLIFIGDGLLSIDQRLRTIETQLTLGKNSAGTNTIRQLILQTCRNTDPARYGSSC